MDEVTDQTTINFGGTLVTMNPIVMMKKHNVTCRPFLGNKLANTFPRIYDSWRQNIAGC
jgi:hypothetical protein